MAYNTFEGDFMVLKKTRAKEKKDYERILRNG